MKWRLVVAKNVLVPDDGGQYWGTKLRTIKVLKESDIDVEVGMILVLAYSAQLPVQGSRKPLDRALNGQSNRRKDG